MRRIVFALIAMFSAALLAVTAAPADARDTIDRRGTETSSATTTVGRLPAHVVRGLKAFEIRDTGRFRTTGRAITYRGKPVVLKKANRKAGPYRFYRQDRTDGEGRFAINFDGRVGTHFKIFLRQTDRNRATSFYIGRIVRN